MALGEGWSQGAQGSPPRQGVWQPSPWRAVGLQRAGRMQARVSRGSWCSGVTASPWAGLGSRAPGRPAEGQLRAGCSLPPCALPTKGTLLYGGQQHGPRVSAGARRASARAWLRWGRPASRWGPRAVSSPAPSLVTAALLRSEAEPGLSCLVSSCCMHPPRQAVASSPWWRAGSGEGLAPG